MFKMQLLVNLQSEYPQRQQYLLQANSELGGIWSVGQRIWQRDFPGIDLNHLCFQPHSEKQNLGMYYVLDQCMELRW